MSLPPIATTHLFPGERAALLDLLRDLSPIDWDAMTVCEGWNVHDVARAPRLRQEELIREESKAIVRLRVQPSAPINRQVMGLVGNVPVLSGVDAFGGSHRERSIAQWQHGKGAGIDPIVVIHRRDVRRKAARVASLSLRTKIAELADQRMDVHRKRRI